MRVYSSPMSTFRIIQCCCIVSSIFVTITNGYQDERFKRSNSKLSSGEFLFPPATDSQTSLDFHIEPPHLHQLRMTRRSEDSEIPENAKRIKRSPQKPQKPKVTTDGDSVDVLEFENQKNVAGLELGLESARELMFKADDDKTHSRFKKATDQLVAPVDEYKSDLRKIESDVKTDMTHDSEAKANLTRLEQEIDLYLAKLKAGNRDNLKLPDLSFLSPGINGTEKVNKSGYVYNVNTTIQMGIPKAENEIKLDIAEPEAKTDVDTPSDKTEGKAQDGEKLKVEKDESGANANSRAPKIISDTGAANAKLELDSLKSEVVAGLEKIGIDLKSTSTTKPEEINSSTTKNDGKLDNTASEIDQNISSDENKDNVNVESTTQTITELTMEEGETQQLPTSETQSATEYSIKDDFAQLKDDDIKQEPREKVDSKVFIKILGIQEIDELREQLNIDMDLTIEWKDGRFLSESEPADEIRKPTRETRDTSLKTREISDAAVSKAKNSNMQILSPEFFNQIWRPDIYLVDMVKVEYPTILGKPVASLKLNKRNGFLSYTVRMTTTVNCPMSFVYYPVDTQNCEFRISSYSHSNDILKIDWMDVNEGLPEIQIEDPSQGNFEVKSKNVEKLELTPLLNNPDGASYDVLRFTIAARRKLSYHLTQTYLFSAFLICLTWLIFMLPYSLYDYRLGTLMMTLLTMFVLCLGVRETVPSTSYMKAIDLWMLGCVLFVFLNIAELVLVTWLSTELDAFKELAEEEDDRNAMQQKLQEDYNYRGPDGKWMKDPEKPNPITIRTIRKFEKYERIFRFLKKYSFKIFVFVFILFTIIYWIWLIVASKYCKWDSDDESVAAA